MTTCDMPDLQDAILEATRDLAHPEDARLAAHLAACEACRAAVTRRERMAAVWSAAAPSDAVVRIAQVRFEDRRRESSSHGGRWAALYFAMGAAAAVAVLAATHRIRTEPLASAPVRPQPAPSIASPVLEPPHVEQASGRAALVDGMRIVLAAGESARIVLEPGKPAIELHGPRIVEVWADPASAAGWRFEYVDPAVAPPPAISAPIAPASPPKATPSSATVAAPTVAESPASSADRAWARAAEALKKNDFAGADSALGTLGAASDAATRDAARLARAELWIGNGRGAAARPVLDDLALRGATPLVRQRAKELLVSTAHDGPVGERR